MNAFEQNEFTRLHRKIAALSGENAALEAENATLAEALRECQRVAQNAQIDQIADDVNRARLERIRGNS